jgi:hypothetical protein
MNPAIDKTIDAVSEAFGEQRMWILSRRRDCRYVGPRQAAMYLLAGRYSLPQIGAALGRDHTTVLYGIRAVEKRLERDPDYAAQVALAGRLAEGPRNDPPREPGAITIPYEPLPEIPVSRLPRTANTCAEPGCRNPKQPGRKRCAECRNGDVTNGRENHV